MSTTKPEQTEQPTSSSAPEEQKNAPQASRSVSRKSRESLWGATLFACMLLFVLVSIGSIGWVTYVKWKNDRHAESQLSIVALAEPSTEEQSEGTPATTPPATDESAGTSMPSDALSTDAKKLELSVLNGGAAKGSAGVLATFLKEEGYLKTDAGNTLQDYTGATVYYTAGLEKEAEIIKQSVAKKYPQAKILAADPTNKETSVSQITVILGK